MTASRDTSHWEASDTVAQYAASWLLRGEQAALAAAFPRGLEGCHILDLACGAGRVTRFLHAQGAEVVGIDISAPMIARARAEAPHIDFRVGDAAALPFADGSFDAVVVALNGLDCLRPREKRGQAVGEVARVVRPGGRLVVSHHNSAALIFGWYCSLRPDKLLHRARAVFSGAVFAEDSYLPAVDRAGDLTYYAWPGRFLAELRAAGFDPLSVHPNDPVLHLARRVLRSDRLTQLADPWPYYVFVKR
jgi:SAM-dependent methyltransferase